LPFARTSGCHRHPSCETTPALHREATPKGLRQTIAVGMAAILGAACVGGLVAWIQQSTQNPLPPRLTAQQLDVDYSKLRASNTTPPSPTQDLLADAPAIMNLDRAKRLAAIGRWQAAIASASSIQPSSPSYQTAQQSIEEWADQLLQSAKQLYAEHQISAAVERVEAIPPTSKASLEAQSMLQQWREQMQIEQSNNQQHWQMAQQAIDQEDGQTAQQEAAQITDDPHWQVRKGAILRQAELWLHLQKANQLLDDGEPENAIDEANRLPAAAPWLERRNRLLDKANWMIADQEADRKRREFCQNITIGFLGECPQSTDLLGSLGQLPTDRLGVKFRKH